MDSEVLVFQTYTKYKYTSTFSVTEHSSSVPNITMQGQKNSLSFVHKKGSMLRHYLRNDFKFEKKAHAIASARTG